MTVTIPVWLLIMLTAGLGYSVCWLLIPPPEKGGDHFPFPDMANLALHALNFMGWVIGGLIAMVVFGVTKGN